MRQAANLKDFHAPNLLPGVTYNTSPSDYRLVRQFQLQRFNGEYWESFGELQSD
jgi:hypothetical protein